MITDEPHALYLETIEYAVKKWLADSDIVEGEEDYLISYRPVSGGDLLINFKFRDRNDVTYDSEIVIDVLESLTDGSMTSTIISELNRMLSQMRELGDEDNETSDEEASAQNEEIKYLGGINL